MNLRFVVSADQRCRYELLVERRDEANKNALEALKNERKFMEQVAETQ